MMENIWKYWNKLLPDFVFENLSAYPDYKTKQQK